MNMLAKSIRKRAAYVRNSGFTVDVDYTLPTVYIYGECGEVFLQEHRAQQFLDSATSVWEEARTVGMNEVLYSEAKMYVESFI